MFPATRLRRLRSHPRLRDLVRETELSSNDFILPLFVRHGKNTRIPIQSMPGHAQMTVVQVQTVGIGIQLHCDFELRSCVQYCLNIQRVGIAT